MDRPSNQQIGNWRDWWADDVMLSREGRRDEARLWSATSRQGVIAAPHYLATAAGAEILMQGGNAIDAAVAASLALGVCEPAGSGLGGMTMMLVHLAPTGRTLVVEGPCAAPRRATPEQVARLANRNRGYQAIAVPANPAVLGHALRNYGSLPRELVCAPAIRLAEAGFPIPRTLHEQTVRFQKPLRRRSGGALFLDAAGRPLPARQRLLQPVLAQTLKRIARDGFEDFYVGEIAGRMVADMQASGGFVGADDLSENAVPRETEPIHGKINGATLKTSGPPAGGLALVHMVQAFSELHCDLDPDRPAGALLTAALIRQARRDRRKFGLTTGDRNVGRAAEILELDFARKSAEKVLKAVTASGETAHVSVVDGEGSAVSMTQSIERCFGSAELTSDLGFLHNGYLRTFKVENKRHPHYLRPGAVARSNAAPTMVFLGDELQTVVGSTGSERMISGIFQVLLRLGKQTPFEAVHAPRLHCTPESEVLLEADRFPAAVLDALTHRGFAIRLMEPYSFMVGGVQLVCRTDQGWCGVADPRRDGAAIGIAR